MCIVQSFLLQAGIRKINYLRNYNNDSFAMELIQQKKIALEKVTLEQADLQALNLERYLNN